jgi:hypothetical protein
MPRYKACYINGKKEISSRAIDTSNHKDAYKRYLEIDGVRNYPIKTYSFSDKTEMLWEEHNASISEQAKKQFELSKPKGDQQIAKKESHEFGLIVEHLQFSNKILGRIEALQERQIDEIKSVQWWMRFGILMILVQIITAKIKLGL